MSDQPTCEPGCVCGDVTCCGTISPDRLSGDLAPNTPTDVLVNRILSTADEALRDNAPAHGSIRGCAITIAARLDALVAELAEERRLHGETMTKHHRDLIALKAAEADRDRYAAALRQIAGNHQQWAYDYAATVARAALKDET